MTSLRRRLVALAIACTGLAALSGVAAPAASAAPTPPSLHAPADQWGCWYVAGNPPIQGCLDNPWPAIDRLLFPGWGGN